MKQKKCIMKFFCDKVNELCRFSKSKDVSNQTNGYRSQEGGKIKTTTKKEYISVIHYLDVAGGGKFIKFLNLCVLGQCQLSDSLGKFCTVSTVLF
jgi:hypothetical protein